MRGTVNELRHEADADAVAAPHHGNAAEDARAHDIADALVRRVVAHLPGHGKLYARAFDRGDDAVALLQRHGHRFLHQDVFARLRGGHGKVRMVAGFAADDHRLHLRVIQHILRVRRVAHPRFAAGGAAALRAVIVPSDQAHIVKLRHDPGVVHHVTVREAEESDTEGCFHLALLSASSQGNEAAALSKDGGRPGLAMAIGNGFHNCVYCVKW